jgi:hypothetical protein
MTIVIDKWGSEQQPDDSGGSIVIDKWGDEGQSMSGLGKAAAGGLGRGTAGMLGLPGEIGSLASVATSKVGSMLGIEPGTVDQFKEQFSQNARYNPLLRPFTQAGSAEVQKNIMEPVTGEFYEPQTQTERYVGSVFEMAPGMLMPGGGLASRALTNVVAPGLAKEGAGQLADKYLPEGSRPYAEVAGAVAGSVIPSMLSRVVTPLPTNQARINNANILRQEGVTDLTAGQVTGRKPLQYLEAERGRGSGLMDSQKEQFTGAVLRRAGINARRATAEVVDDAFTRIGQQFDDLAARNVAPVDRPLLVNVQQSLDDYHRLVNPPSRSPAVQGYFDELQTAALRHNGQIPGEVYQSLRSRMEADARALVRDTHSQQAIREMRGALDAAMERGIARTNPADLGAWREARNQYRNMLVIEKAAAGAGDATEGLISPAKLRQATVSTHGMRNYARGRGDFADLSRAGSNIMAELPNSGTAGRISAQNLGLPGILSAIGGIGGTSVGGVPGGVAGAVAGAALPRLAGRAATSAPGRAYLGNQWLTPDIDAGSAAIANLLQSLRMLPESSAPRITDSR